ncbi:hypothetical protein SCOR_03540 [Sulfidibacter corallicola]
MEAFFHTEHQPRQIFSCIKNKCHIQIKTNNKFTNKTTRTHIELHYLLKLFLKSALLYLNGETSHTTVFYRLIFSR